MRNSELAAFAAVAPPSKDKQGYLQEGLTKREYFAIETIKGIQISVYSSLEMYEHQLKHWQEVYGETITVKEAIAKDAIQQADELLKQLEG
jgi:hypothetical protein